MIWSKSNSLIVSTIKFKSRRPKKDTTPKQQNFKKAKESAYFADFNEQINPKDLSKKYHKWREFKICIQILNQLVSILEIKQVMNLELELERIRNWRGNVMNCVNFGGHPILAVNSNLMHNHIALGYYSETAKFQESKRINLLCRIWGTKR